MSKINFREINIADKENFEQISKSKSEYIYWEASFSCVFCWSSFYGLTICLNANYLILKYDNIEGIYFNILVNNEISFLEVFNILKEYCIKMKLDLDLRAINQNQFEILNQLGYNLIEDRDAYDYVYNCSDLINLKGKKYHSKRNFINRFKQLYNYTISEYNINDYEQLISLYKLWFKNKNDELLDSELIQINKALKYYDILGLKCMILKVYDKIISFNITDISLDIPICLFEKADTNYEGVFQAINYFFSNKYLTNYKYINRQEDLGIEGLRKAKLSYYPAILVKKYRLNERSLNVKIK